jgi:hypothetical protein
MTACFKILALGAGLALLLPGAPQAADGTRLIDQSRALAGGLTPGDAAGFPVTISQAGSYRLSGNLTVPDANTTAIEITAENVSLDLNGFSILGPTVCSGIPISCAPLGVGVGVLSTQSYTGVRNGIVRGMGSDAVRLLRLPGGGASQGHVVSDLQVAGNGGDGISMSGGIARQSVVRRNGGRGVVMDSGLITGNQISQNGSTGARISGTGMVSANTVSDNDGCGISMNSGLASGNNLLQNNGGLCLTTAGYLGNTLIVNAVGGGFNLGQNLCATLGGMALCP